MSACESCSTVRCPTDVDADTNHDETVTTLRKDPCHLVIINQQIVRPLQVGKHTE